MNVAVSLGQVPAVAAGGTQGSVLRYALSHWVHHVSGQGFPYGTLVVSVLGCLLMGFLFVLFMERLGERALWRAGLLIGVLGGFTTFSAFSMETFNLFEQGAWIKATGNMAASLVLCVGVTALGVSLARQL